MSLWHAVKWAGLVALVLVLALGLARLFSGEEHDQPLGPPSGADRVVRGVLPWVILGAAVGALAGAGLLSARSPATRETLGQSLRFFGAVSIAAGVLAGAVLLAVGVLLAAGACCGPGELSSETLFVLLGLLGLAAFLALVSVDTYGTKKVLEAHYDLKRHAAMLQDTLEILAQGKER